MFVLVRHAHAGDKQTWPWPDEERPLTELGRRQAQALVHLLADLPVTRLLSSPVRRCRETLTPLGDARGLPVVDEPLLEPDGDLEALERILVHEDVEGAVLSTHGEFMDRLLGRWHDQGRLAFEGHGPVDTDKGAAWIVEGFGRPGARARYLPPVPSEDGERS